jgi:hypothetical protein
MMGTGSLSVIFHLSNTSYGKCAGCRIEGMMQAAEPRHGACHPSFCRRMRGHSLIYPIRYFNPPKRNENTLLKHSKFVVSRSPALICSNGSSTNRRGARLSVTRPPFATPEYEHDDERSAVSLDPTSSKMEQARQITEYCWAIS